MVRGALKSTNALAWFSMFSFSKGRAGRNESKESQTRSTNHSPPGACLNLANTRERPVETRRDLLRTQAAGMVAAFAAAAGEQFAAPKRAEAQTELTPDAALKELVAGNSRFTRGQMTALDEDLKILKRKTAEQQKPFAAVLSCAD